MATHPEITDPVLRKIMANELLVMRRTARRIGATMRDQQIAYNMLGFETALRRVSYAMQSGFELNSYPRLDR